MATTIVATTVTISHFTDTQTALRKRRSANRSMKFDSQTQE